MKSAGVHVFGRWGIWALLAALAVPGARLMAQSADDEPLPPPKPIIIANVASVERSLKDIGKMFELADREDMTDLLHELLDERAGSLKGLDRERPLGLMLFLEESLPPQPRPVVYVPVENETDFIRTLELAPGTIKKKAEGEYELTRNRGNRTMHMRIRDGYALFSVRDPEGSFLERDLPDPQQVSAGLTSRYDAAVSVQIRNLPSALREVFIGMFKAQGQAELQQRDDEPDAVYQLRKSNGMSMMTLIEQVLRDGEQITLGIDSAPDGSRSVIELVIDAVPESEYSKVLKNIAGKPTYFEPLLNERNPLTISVSTNLDKREQTAFTGVVEAFRLGLSERLPPTVTSSVEKMADSLQATVDQAQMDLMFQFIPKEKDQFLLLGGMKIAGPGSFAAALKDVLIAVAEMDALESIEVDAHEHQSAFFHRLKTKESSSEELRIYGGRPDIYVGVSGNVLWFGLGADGLLETLDTSIDITNSTTPGERTGSTAPIQVVFRLLPWMTLPPPEGDNPIGRDLVNAAITEDNDAVRIEFRPSETGGRLRLQFDGGFVKLMGSILASFYDSTQL